MRRKRRRWKATTTWLSPQEFGRHEQQRQRRRGLLGARDRGCGRSLTPPAAAAGRARERRCMPPARAARRCATSTRRTSASGAAQLPRCRRSPPASPAATPAGRAGSSSARPPGRADRAAQAAQRRDHPFPWRLELAGCGLPGLGRIHQCAIDGRQVAAGAQERARIRSTSAGGGGSSAKWRASLVAMCRAVAGATASRRGWHAPAFRRLLVALAQDVRAPGSCSAGAKTKRPGSSAAASSGRPRRRAPAGQRPREFGHVVLRVAAAHAERVQLQDLAREILVEAALALGIGRAARRAATLSGPIERTWSR